MPHMWLLLCSHNLNQFIWKKCFRRSMDGTLQIKKIKMENLSTFFECFLFLSSVWWRTTNTTHSTIYAFWCRKLFLFSPSAGEIPKFTHTHLEYVIKNESLHRIADLPTQHTNTKPVIGATNYFRHFFSLQFFPSVDFHSSIWHRIISLVSDILHCELTWMPLRHFNAFINQTRQLAGALAAIRHDGQRHRSEIKCMAEKIYSKSGQRPWPHSAN